MFEIVHINYNQNKIKQKVKRSNKNVNQKAACSTNSKHSRPKTLELKVNFTGKQEDRIAVRKDMLQNHYFPDNHDDELYDEFLDQLISFEESLIEDIS